MTQAQIIMGNKMMFGGFVFPSNPSEVLVECSNSIKTSQYIDSTFSVREIGNAPTVISGKGVFFGSAAGESCVELSQMLKTGKSTWLVLPDANPIYAYLKEFSYNLDCKKGYAQYSFKFVECENKKRYHKYLDYVIAKRDDNCFTIANKEDVSVTDLMLLNNYKSPFDVTLGERVKIR